MRSQNNNRTVVVTVIAAVGLAAACIGFGNAEAAGFRQDGGTPAPTRMRAPARMQAPMPMGRPPIAMPVRQDPMRGAGAPGRGTGPVKPIFVGRDGHDTDRNPLGGREDGRRGYGGGHGGHGGGHGHGRDAGGFATGVAAGLAVDAVEAAYAPPGYGSGYGYGSPTGAFPYQDLPTAPAPEGPYGLEPYAGTNPYFGEGPVPDGLLHVRDRTFECGLPRFPHGVCIERRAGGDSGAFRVR